jgi:hypothetical protein
LTSAEISSYSARSYSNSWNSPLLKCGLAASVTYCNFELESRAWGFSKSGGVTSVTDWQCARRDTLMSFWSR